MLLLTPPQTASLRDRFLPDQPGPLVGLHVIQTGHGACFADRWPAPRALLTDTAGNYALTGDPAALVPADLQGRISGFVDAPAPFVPLLHAAFPAVTVWERVILDLAARPVVAAPSGFHLQRLEAADAYLLWGLSPELAWIAKTWGGPPGLAASGQAWGAFAGQRLVAVACPFFVGVGYEDLGVVTEPAFRGLGLSGACASAVCGDILERGRRPSWTTATDNRASMRVAEKLGFVQRRQDRLYIVGIAVPAPPRRGGR